MHPSPEQQLISLRREFHMYPEAGWTEFRTTARIVEELISAGIPVRWGREIHSREHMLGLPSHDILEQAWQRALEQTGLEDILIPMRGGYTGCIARIDGILPGKTTLFRVDIDSCQLDESTDAEHTPIREGFYSRNPGCMHACGHDAHAAIGIGTAKLLWQQRDKLRGTVFILFQPAEEGLRGAASMAAAALPEHCDYLIGLHVGIQDMPTGTVAASCNGFLSSTKLDIAFHGKAAHAGICPELGRNALAAGAKATLDLLALPEKYSGLCRVNVGTFHAGSGRNVIPAQACLEAETRSDSADQNIKLCAEADAVCSRAANAYGCTVDTVKVGGANGAECDCALVGKVLDVLSNVPQVTRLLPSISFGGSEDITTLMQTVQSNGGLATELLIGMPLIAPHHSSRFDIDEKVIPLGAEILTTLGLSLG